MLCLGLSQTSFAAAVAARVASVKGTVNAGGGGEQGTGALRPGATVRAGTVIEAARDSGLLLRPAPKISLVVYASTKVRFDGAEINGQGRGSVKCSVLNGRVLVIIDPEENTTGPGKVKVTVTTEEGAIVGSKGTWTVRQDEGRTVVAVSEGLADVSIGGGTAAGAGEVGGQVEVPEGSVIWLQRREDGLVEARLINAETGTMIVILPDGSRDTSQKPTPEMLSEARGFFDGSGDSFAPLPNPSTPTDGTPSNTPTNPDYSQPKPDLPIVSKDTP